MYVLGGSMDHRGRKRVRDAKKKARPGEHAPGGSQGGQRGAIFSSTPLHAFVSWHFLAFPA